MPNIRDTGIIARFSSRVSSKERPSSWLGIRWLGILWLRQRGRRETKQTTPPPKTGDSKSSNGSLGSSLALPPPKKRRDGPVRITVEAPKFDDADDNDSERAQKKPRTLGPGTKGAGSSSLFSALPAPKNATPILPEPKRVLGGGGGPALNFSTASTTSSDTQSTSNGLFLPPAMAKAKAQAKPPPPAIESAPSVDFFSLGSTSAAPSIPTSGTAPSTSSSITLMSAPEVKDFEPPVPTLFDPYPGYYQLPSGEWAMHDPKYYKKVIEQLTSGPDLQTGNKSEAREFADRSKEDMATFDPSEELRQGQIAELEKRKAVTTTPSDAPAVPRMKANYSWCSMFDHQTELLYFIQVQKSTGLARSRHQLSTLLTEAYANREALEEKIAQGKRNRKEAGSKYGF
ncbi:mitotic checkpoint protein prcc-carboxy-term protein [Rhizoctonia solani]|uniref:Mitotic checkpoint protein prcc-carboxy-term protein n=1 Tax=Rhizoctonia solani TaxID=456999 RepID=A0A8H8T1Z2_9AGAM|nr:mitotic checkpoint protein prcc-carboxy-term protein [Rhizoctonia solani]QRW26966.1 mitotic checkpoint protein prcc-carboxy-term protein [Rhizoctonia solani]